MTKHQSIFKNHYKQILSEDLVLKQKISCIPQLMKLDRIIISYSSSLSQKNVQFLIPPVVAKQLITAQKPKITQSKKAVANFQTRKNEPIGSVITLKTEKAYSFLEKLVYLYLPRQQNNTKKNIYSNVHQFGIDDCLLFPECESFYDLFHTKYIHGLNINIQTKNNHKYDKSNKMFLSGFLVNTF